MRGLSEFAFSIVSCMSCIPPTTLVSVFVASLYLVLNLYFILSVCFLFYFGSLVSLLCVVSFTFQ